MNVVLNWSRLLLCAIFSFLCLTNVLAADFYEGKTLRIVVGSPPGGGFDLYSRLVARHMPKHIPGRPTIIVENMPGAGSLVAANHAYNIAKPDGLSIWMWNVNFIQNGILGDNNVRFDARNFGWIGSAATTTYTCAIMGFTGLKTFDELRKSRKPLKMGATGFGTQGFVQPKLLNMFLGTNFNIIPGYKGTPAIQLAMQRAELDGSCWGWQSMKVSAANMINAEGGNRLIPILIDKRMEDTQVKNVPVVPELIKDKTNLATYLAWSAPSQFFRPFVVPPATPTGRLNILRQAFRRIMQDPEFISDATKVKLDIDYTSGEEVETLVEKIVNMPPQAKDLLRPLMIEEK